MGYRKLGRNSSQRRAMLRSLVTSLLDAEKITTTETRAKEVTRLTERMITLGKRGDLHARRRAMAFLLSEDVAKKLFDKLASRYAERQGGYTRIVRLVPRRGDAAPQALIELV